MKFERRKLYGIFGPQNGEMPDAIATNKDNILHWQKGI